MARLVSLPGFLALMALGTYPLSAQTTQTERAAAGDVLKEIEALQSKLAPSKSAERLTTAKSPDKDRVVERVGALWDGEMQGLSDWIGKHPEVGWKEFMAVDTLVKVLRKAGFTVDTGLAGLKTAFVATWVSPAGSGPVLGIIGEYDALRDTEGPFHGDQHNAQSPVAIAAALALKEYITQKKIPHIRLGQKRVVIRKTELEKWLESHTTTALN